jgi:ATP-dependent RNA helicase RhlE
MSFNELGLSSTLLQAVQDTGYTIPTPIQVQAIPAILSGKDVMAAAQTGTGKTAGFTLPLLQLLSGKPPVTSNHTRALVLTPTRELAAQIQESIETYGKHEQLRSVVIFGGVKINPQQMALRRGCDILVATPGRLLDLYQQNAIKFTELEVLVLDEADRMLDMGFIRDIRKILQVLPKKRQNLMFSATFSDDIRALAKTICHQPLEIDVAPRNSTVETVTQQYYQVSKEKKLPLLGHLLKSTADQVLVFSRTKHGANNLVKKLAGYEVTAAAIHGNKSQAQRTKALADFKANRVQVLVATDIAARGIDIDLLAMVINFDLPQVAEDYVHRIGRTGRAGASGLAVSLVTDEDNGQMKAIERLIKRKVPRMEYDSHSLPVPKAVAAHDDSDDDELDSEGNSQPRRAAPPRSRSGQSRGGQSRAGQARGTQSSGAQASGGQPRNGQGSGGQRGQSRNNPRPAQQGSALAREGRESGNDLREPGNQARSSQQSARSPGGQPRRSHSGGSQGRSQGNQGAQAGWGGDGSARPQGRSQRSAQSPQSPHSQSPRAQQPRSQSGRADGNTSASRPVSGNREGASFAPPARPAGDNFWNKLGSNLRKGKLFSRK